MIESKPLPVILKFWMREVGHVRYFTPEGKWKHVTKLSEARSYADKHGFNGIKIRVYA